MSDAPNEEPEARSYIIWLCDPCIEGEGEMCHTPECTLCWHAVDIPIGKELLTEVPNPLAAQAAVEMLKALIAAEQAELLLHQPDGAFVDWHEANSLAIQLRAAALAKARGEDPAPPVGKASADLNEGLAQARAGEFAKAPIRLDLTKADE